MNKIKLGPLCGPRWPDNGLSDDAILLLGKLGGEKFFLAREERYLEIESEIAFKLFSLETLAIGERLEKRVVYELTREKLISTIPLVKTEQRAAFYAKLDASTQETLEALRHPLRAGSPRRDFLMITKEGRRAFEFYLPKISSLKKEQEADRQSLCAEQQARAEESLEMLEFVLRRA